MSDRIGVHAVADGFVRAVEEVPAEGEYLLLCFVEIGHEHIQVQLLRGFAPFPVRPDVVIGAVQGELRLVTAQCDPDVIGAVPGPGRAQQGFVERSQGLWVGAVHHDDGEFRARPEQEVEVVVDGGQHLGCLPLVHTRWCAQEIHHAPQEMRLPCRIPVRADVTRFLGGPQ